MNYKSSSRAAMKRILCIWLPNWPIQRLVVDQPELNGTAIVLYAHDPRKGQRVVFCSQQARRLGIQVGMPFAEATAISQHGPDNHSPRGARRSNKTSSCEIIFSEHTPANDHHALQQLAEWCEQFSPVVGLDAPDSASGLLLDITGIGSLFQGEEQLAQLVVDRFSDRGYWAHVAVAGTIGAAWAMAHYGIRFDSRRGKPAEPRVISNTETSIALASLPIESLRLSASSIELLHRLGIDQIEQLETLPREGLVARLGDEITLRLDQATGQATEIINAHHIHPEFQSEWVLEHPTSDQEVILQIAEHVCHHLANLLQAEDQGAVQVRCWMETTSQPTKVEIGLFRPTSEAAHLLQLLRMQLERCHLPGPLSRMCLQAIHTARITRKQQRLWDQPGGDPRQLADLVDRLSSRLGPTSVLAARMRAGTLPEDAYALIPLTGPQNSKARLNSAAGKRKPLGPGQRPLQLLHPPQPLQALSVSHGPPIQFSHAGRNHRVVQHWGPERIETAWWHGHCIRRDYYRVECQTGCRFWLFRRLDNQHWFLHGRF